MQTEGTTAQLSSGARVDVLAVMQAAADKLHHSDPTAYTPGIIAARAAVAELVAAATDAHDFAANAARNSGGELDRRFYRLRAALAPFSEAQS